MPFCSWPDVQPHCSLLGAHTTLCPETPPHTPGLAPYRSRFSSSFRSECRHLFFTGGHFQLSWGAFSRFSEMQMQPRNSDCVKSSEGAGNCGETLAHCYCPSPTSFRYPFFGNAAQCLRSVLPDQASPVVRKIWFLRCSQQSRCLAR